MVSGWALLPAWPRGSGRRAAARAAELGVGTIRLSSSSPPGPHSRPCPSTLRRYHQRLRTLKLRNNRIDGEAAGYLARCLKKHRHLAHLDLSGNCLMGEQGARRQGCPRRLSMQRARCPSAARVGGPPVVSEHRTPPLLPPAGVLHVADLLRNLPGLRDLGLADCDAGDGCADGLAAALSGHPSLTRLDLSCNQLSPAGMAPAPAPAPAPSSPLSVVRWLTVQRSGSLPGHPSCQA
jgi:hypothetical protein